MRSGARPGKRVKNERVVVTGGPEQLLDQLHRFGVRKLGNGGRTEKFSQRPGTQFGGRRQDAAQRFSHVGEVLLDLYLPLVVLPEDNAIFGEEPVHRLLREAVSALWLLAGLFRDRVNDVVEVAAGGLVGVIFRCVHASLVDVAIPRGAPKVD